MQRAKLSLTKDSSSPDEANLAAEAAKRAMYRVNHVGTRLNESELRAFEALAVKRNQTQGELIRGLILAEQALDIWANSPWTPHIRVRAQPAASSQPPRSIFAARPLTA